MVKQIFQDEINAAKAIKAAPRQQRLPFTPLPAQLGIGRNDVIEFDDMTFAGVAEIRSGSGPDTSSQRRGLGNRLKFGLEGLGLSREELALQREGLGLSQEELGLNRRDALEGAINNALQRGIFQSGIRIRNEERVNERADLQDARLALQSQGLDITGKRLDLSEKELRANIKNALAGLRSQAADMKRQREIDLEQQRAMLRDQMILEAGGIFPSVGREVEGMVTEGGVR